MSESILQQLTATLAKLEARLERMAEPALMEDRALDAKEVAARYSLSMRGAERLLKKHGIRVDRELRIPLRTLRKLEETGPHYLGTFGR
jgi:hypothetical protein